MICFILMIPLALSLCACLVQKQTGPMVPIGFTLESQVNPPNRNAFRWKPVLCLSLLFTALFLTACIQQPIRIEGRVIETSPGGDNAQTLYFVRTEKGETKCVALDEHTFIDPDVNGLDEADVRACRTGDIMVCADCHDSHDEASLDDGTLVQAYPADTFFVTSHRTKETTVMEDDTEVEIWESSASREYRLKDGTLILRAADRSGPENATGPSGTSLDDLNEPARRKISQYYSERGLLYDVDTQLALAYTAYQNRNAEEAFDGQLAVQDTHPTFSNARIIALVTSISTPTQKAWESTFSEYGEVFDRATGEHLDNLDLFTCSRNEVISRLLDLCSVGNDKTLRPAMESAFRSEYLVFFPEEVDLVFPSGTLRSEPCGYIISFDYEDLEGLLHDWVIPEK